MLETDTTSSELGNAQVDVIEVDITELDLLVSHRGQKVAHSGIDSECKNTFIRVFSKRIHILLIVN